MKNWIFISVILLLGAAQFSTYHFHRHIFTSKNQIQDKIIIVNFNNIIHQTMIVSMSTNVDNYNDINDDFNANDSPYINNDSVQNNHEKSIKYEIETIIDYYLNNTSNKPIERSNPSLLIENAFLLSKSNYYEAIMDEKLNQCSSYDDILNIEKVDNYLRKFILSERKSRARLKLNYLLAGASTERFNEAIQTLSEW